MIAKSPVEETTKILPHHLEQLKGSGLTLNTCLEAGIYSESNHLKIRSLLECKERKAKRLTTVLVFPFQDIDGRNGYSRVKPDRPRIVGDRVIKYESPEGKPNQVYIPPGARPYLDTKAELIITEGEKKALKATQEGFPTLGLVGVWGWKQKDHASLLPTLDRIDWKQRRVVVAFDSDIQTNTHVQDAERWLCHYLRTRGADIKVIRLPTSGEGKTGLDDFLVANGPAKLRELLDSPDDAPELDPEIDKQPAIVADPCIEAGKLIDSNKFQGFSRLRFWCGSFWWWAKGKYREVPNSEVRAMIVQHLNENYRKVGTSEVSNTLEQLRAQSLLQSVYQPPTWITGQAWKAEDVVATANAIVHLPSFVSQKDSYSVDASPAYFTTSAVDYEFHRERPACPRWDAFLSQLWPNDPQSIELLQDWFGYCLTPDTRQQKILMLIGPKRSGKGTIARVIRSVVGEGNVCGPTLASLQTNFGLWPILGKTLAVISDARLSGRSDQAIITERLLSISGEDAQTVDRKNLEPVTTKLLARFMIISNELPRLQDSSGALAGRMLVLKLTNSFYGHEDRGLTEALATERAGILHWAIDGWKRLRDRGFFQQPASGDELKEQMDELSSPISAFVSDRCTVNPAATVECKELFDAWKEWCNESGRDSSTIQTFGRDLTALLPEIHVRNARFGASRVRKYDGIGLSVGF